MVWKLTKQAQNWEPLPGVPWRDMEDTEFRVVAREFAERNQHPPRSLHNSGFFEHVGAEADAEKEEA